MANCSEVSQNDSDVEQEYQRPFQNSDKKERTLPTNQTNEDGLKYVNLYIYWEDMHTYHGACGEVWGQLWESVLILCESQESKASKKDISNYNTIICSEIILRI